MSLAVISRLNYLFKEQVFRHEESINEIRSPKSLSLKYPEMIRRNVYVQLVTAIKENTVEL
ncbi:hypothetical protein HYALB_00000244 [Hymenoscyphus albidus]|uniref:Uncharacterized protein n=1 Tax=Hymenoscyphus albidus TaxID=595503 RepID=A0A9N9Q9L2_9HELO|nr:hypothetical protein HYALB_00000244 [Hymenoscyphus albidus]